MAAAIDSPERRAHATSTPSRDGLARLATSLGADHFGVIRRLGGGIVTAAHLVRRADSDELFVLKRFMPGDAPGATREWERLSIADAVAVPTPHPVAFDPTGTWFSGPSLLMSALEGAPIYLQRDAQPEQWVPALAGALASIHSAPTSSHSALGSSGPRDTRVPGNRTSPPLVAHLTRAIERLRTETESEPRVLSHGDFHPGNVLFTGSDVTGVVDWAGARAQPRGEDVAQCRCELAIWPGGDAPDQFLEAYRSLTGEPLHSQPLWDCLAVDLSLEWHHLWLWVYTEFGISLDPAIVRANLQQFAARALADV